MQTFKISCDWKLILPEDTISKGSSSFITKAANKIAEFLEAQLVHYVIIDDTITIIDLSTHYCGDCIVHYSDVKLIDIDNETIKNY